MVSALPGMKAGRRDFHHELSAPLREVVGSLERGESPLFKETTNVYLRDVYDHTIQVMDTIETF